MPFPTVKLSCNVSCFDPVPSHFAFIVHLLGDRRVPDIPNDWIDIVDPCVQSMRGQVKEELKAAMQYLAMASYFSRDAVNRPGFAKLFFEAASEEREHAIKLISYLIMRGELTSNVSKLIDRRVSVKKCSIVLVILRQFAVKRIQLFCVWQLGIVKRVLLFCVTANCVF